MVFPEFHMQQDQRKQAGDKFSGQSSRGCQGSGGKAACFQSGKIAEQGDGHPNPLFQKLSGRRDSGPLSSVVIGGGAGVGTGKRKGEGHQAQQGRAAHLLQDEEA